MHERQAKIFDGFVRLHWAVQLQLRKDEIARSHQLRQDHSQEANIREAIPWDSTDYWGWLGRLLQICGHLPRRLTQLRRHWGIIKQRQPSALSAENTPLDHKDNTNGIPPLHIGRLFLGRIPLQIWQIKKVCQAFTWAFWGGAECQAAAGEPEKTGEVSEMMYTFMPSESTLFYSYPYLKNSQRLCFKTIKHA